MEQETIQCSRCYGENPDCDCCHGLENISLFRGTLEQRNEKISQTKEQQNETYGIIK